MSREKWNEICFILSENIHRQISEDLFEKYMIQALRVLGWKQFLNEIDVRPSFQIGASNRIAPDLIIKSETQERLFVIEIKQPHLPLNLGFQKQLFSYMRQLKLEYGLLIGSEIQLFYDGEIIPHDDPVLLKTITFRRDSEEGVRFVDLFGKDTFSYDRLSAEVNYYRSKQEQEEQTIRLRKELLTEQFHRDVTETIKRNLNTKYDSAVIENVFRNITISINEDVTELYTPESPININKGEGQIISGHIAKSHNKSEKEFIRDLAEEYIKDEVQKRIFLESGVWMKVRLNYIAGLILTNRGRTIFSPKDIRDIVRELIPTLNEIDDGQLSGMLLTQDVHFTAASPKWNNGYPCLENMGRGQYRFVGFRELSEDYTAKNRLAFFDEDNSALADFASFDMEGQRYLLKRFKDSSIRIIDMNNQIFDNPVKPILRKIIDSYNLNIELYFDSGSKKNTRTLGKEVIQALNNKLGNSRLIQNREGYTISASQTDCIIELINSGIQQSDIEEQLAKRYNKNKQWAKDRLHVYSRHYGESGILDCRVNLEAINPINLSQKYLDVYRYLSKLEDKSDQQQVRTELYQQMNPKNPNRMDTLEEFLKNS